MESIPYRSAIGSLLYLATCTRPDLAAAVSELSKFSQNPGLAHWEGVKRVLRYGVVLLGMGSCTKGMHRSRYGDTRMLDMQGIMRHPRGKVDMSL